MSILSACNKQHILVCADLANENGPSDNCTACNFGMCHSIQRQAPADPQEMPKWPFCTVATGHQPTAIFSHLWYLYSSSPAICHSSLQNLNASPRASSHSILLPSCFQCFLHAESWNNSYYHPTARFWTLGVVDVPKGHWNIQNGVNWNLNYVWFMYKRNKILS